MTTKHRHDRIGGAGMSEREELAALLNRTINDEFSPGDDVDDEVLSDAILAAGWSRPRVVSSMDEVAALPVGSVVLDAFGATCTKTGAGLLGWRRVTTAVAGGAGHWHAPYVPLTVLFEGAA